MENLSEEFSIIEKEFKNVDKEAITEIVISSLEELMYTVQDFPNEAKIGIMITGSRLGVSGDGVVSEEEKKLICEVYRRFCAKDKINEIIDIIGTEIEDSDYERARKVTELGTDTAMAFLRYVLGFAYIDGMIESDIAEKLDKIFEKTIADSINRAKPLCQHFTMYGFEAEIANWFESLNELGEPVQTLQSILDHYPNKNKNEVQKALNRLVNKDVLNTFDCCGSPMYLLADKE